MAVAGDSYVSEREGVLYIGETRVALSSLIAAWRTEGYTAEEAHAAFPALSLAQVYGAIAYYLERQASLDAAWTADAEEYQRRRAEDRANHPAFHHSLNERRERLRQRLNAPLESRADDESRQTPQ